MRGDKLRKARRRKRQVARDAAWVPAPAFEEAVSAETDFDEIGEAVAAIDEWLVGRGWLLDTDNAGEGLLSWVSMTTNASR